MPNAIYDRLLGLYLNILLMLIFFATSGTGRVMIDPGFATGIENVAIGRLYFYCEMVGALLLTISCYLNFHRFRWRTNVTAILPYLALASFTLLTTANFTVTSNHLLRLLAIVISCDAYVRIRGSRQLIRVLVITLLVLNILSLIAVFAVPGIGKHGAADFAYGANSGAWKGITSQKNFLGRAASFAAIILIFFPDILGWSRLGCYVAGALCLVNLAGSQSGTAIIAFLSVLITYVFFLRRNMTLVSLVSGIALFATTALLVIASQEFLLGMLGKEQDLTGRDAIWAFSWKIIESQPSLGYGFDAGAPFWRPVMQKLLFPSAIDAHNAYIQTVIDMGWLGLAALIVMLLVAFTRAFLRHLGNENMTIRANSALGLLLLASVVVGVTEISPFSITSDVGFITFVAITCIASLRRGKVGDALK